MVVEFVTQHPQTGAATDADVLPTGTVVLNGVDTAAVVTVANKATGVYIASFTPPTLATEDMLALRVAATVAGVVGIGVVWQQHGHVPLALAVVDANVNAIKLITDTLDVTAVSQVAASSAGHLTITAGLTFSESVTGLTIPADWVAAIWTLKYSAEQADTAAVVALRAENPAALTDGLQRVNRAAPAAPITAADGSLTVTQASGQIDIWLSDELTVLLSKATGLGWDVKFVDEDGDSTGQRGTADVVLTETKAVA